MMKLTAILIFLASMQVSARSDAQTISLSGKNISLEKVFKEIKRQSGYLFLYNVQMLKRAKPVDIDVKNGSVQEVLDICFRDQPFTYEIIDNTVVVKARPARTAVLEPAVSPPPPGNIDVHGKVANEKGDPEAGVTVRVKGTNKATATDENGAFSLNGIEPNATLVFSSINLETLEVNVNGKTELSVKLKTRITALDEVSVNRMNTGYQDIPKERSTGSFVQVSNPLLNRRVSSDLLSRLEGIAPGLLFNRNTLSSAEGKLNLSIRGHSTLFANDQPLVVLDNFPYDGDLSTINPNDVENITILRDAAAASIWGVRAGNGVIVINTKKGRAGQKLSVEFNSNITFGRKPDMFYNPNFLNAPDFIDLEKTLFAKGFYDADLSNANHPPVSPVVEILSRQRAGLISNSDADMQINGMRGLDIRRDMTNYLYRPSLTSQYALGIRGGGASNSYYFSLGFDHNSASLLHNQSDRMTVSANNTFFMTKNLELSLGLNFIQNTAATNDAAVLQPGGGKNMYYPYAQLADGSGNALALVKDYRYGYIDTAGAGKLLDWKYRPLDEARLADNNTRSTDVRVNIGLKYALQQSFNAELKYQYQYSGIMGRSYNNDQTWFTRDMINTYSSINGTTVTRPVPAGGILDFARTDQSSNRLRGQLNFNHSWEKKHALTAIAGAEINEIVVDRNSNRLYGYDDNMATHSNVDFITRFKFYYNPANTAQIPNVENIAQTTNRYLSYFANAAYTWLDRYTFSLSGRIDKSNLFGVSANQKQVPLYSLGGSWDINKEPFYHLGVLPNLKLRASYGYSGNLFTNVTAFTTAAYSSSSPYYSGLQYATVTNPGNPDLSWEKISMFNIGVEYAFANQKFSGSIDYYRKKGVDLIGSSPLAPSTGLTQFTGNKASTQGQGFDFVLNARVLNRAIKWNAQFSCSYAQDVVTGYNVKSTTGEYILNSAGNSGSVFPLQGKPVFSLFSYVWAGLDPTTGDPRGYLNGQNSNNYAKLLYAIPTDSMLFNGPSRPTTYGALRNTFSWRDFSLSFNLVYKFNYFFRTPSISYSGLFQSWAGNKDYLRRWQKPGDENFTNVPSIQYPPVDGNRDQFYALSEVLIEKGDHIRLQDISLSYDMDKTRTWPLRHTQVYMYANNIGILWRANDKGLDPDTWLNNLLPLTLSLGIKINF